MTYCDHNVEGGARHTRQSMASVWSSCVVAFVVCAGAQGAYAQQPGAEPAASEAPRVVATDISRSCASVPTEQAFLDELRVRVPAEVATFEPLLEAPVDALWRLSWVPSTQQGCTLTLRDTEALLEVPLEAKVAPSERMSDVAVRVAWFLTTHPPRRVEQEEPSAPIAAVDTMPVITPVEGAAAPHIGDASAVRGAGVSDVARERALQVEPSGAGAPLDLGPQGRPSLMRALFDQLFMWRTSSPELFGSFEPEQMGESPTLGIGGEPTELGGNLTVRIDAATIGYDFALVKFLNLRAGLVLDERIALNLAYRGTLSETTVGIDGELGTVELALHQGGLEVEYVFWSRRAFTLSTSVALLAGGMWGRGADSGDWGDGRSQFLLSGELQGQIFYELLPWMQIGAGFGANGAIMGETYYMDLDDAFQPFGSMSLRLKVF